MTDQYTILDRDATGHVDIRHEPTRWPKLQAARFDQQNWNGFSLYAHWGRMQWRARIRHTPTGRLRIAFGPTIEAALDALEQAVQE